jgi:RNA polymerase sigma factor (sigma-70 family)
MQNYTDDQLLDGIKSGDRLILTFIYRQFLPMARHICGNQSDGEIIFSEVLESIWRRLQTEKIELSCKLSTYLYGSLWRAWAKKQRKPINFQHQLPVEHLEAAKYAEQMDTDFERTDRARLVSDCLAKLGEICQKLLQLAFFEDRSNEEILTEMQFSSDGFLRKKKTECKTKLIDLCRADARFSQLSSLTQ